MDNLRDEKCFSSRKIDIHLLLTFWPARHYHWRIRGGTRDSRLHFVQFLSFLCKNRQKFRQKSCQTRRHSSRMRTARSSSSRRGLHQAPPPGSRPPSPRGSRHHPPPTADTPGAYIPPVDRHTPVNILPCPKLRLRAVIIGF